MTFAAARQNVPVAAGGLGEGVVVVAGLAFLAPGQMGGGQLTGQPPIPLRPAGQHQQMRAGRIGDVGADGIGQRQFGTEHRRHTVFPRGLGEAHHPVQPVVVGEGDRAQAQPYGLLDKLLRGAGTVEEAERRMGVQLGVGHRRTAAGQVALRRQVAGTFTRPGRTVAAVGDRLRQDPMRPAGRLREGPAAQHPLHLRPTRRPVVPAHPVIVSNVCSNH